MFHKKISKEYLYLSILLIIVLMVGLLDRDSNRILWADSIIFLNYISGGLIISYYAIPKLYYNKKNIQFILYFLVTSIVIILMEEFVLEQIFFADSRGRIYTGIVHTFLEALPVLSLIIGFKIVWDFQQKRVELEKLKYRIYESELQFLKSQINPHFLFNNMNNLYSYALENSPKTPEIILQLSSLLRYMLYECRASKVPLSKEVDCLADFIKLQELQIESRGDIIFNVKGNTIGTYIAPMILIVFIENCFKHTISSQSDKICIDISLEVENSVLYLYCKNSFTENSNTKNISGGIGLDNVQSRLKMLYPNSHKLNITTDNNYFFVSLMIDTKDMVDVVKTTNMA